MVSEVKSLSHVWLFASPWTVAHQALPSMDFSREELPEWVAISFSRGSSRPRDQTRVSRIAGRHFTIWATRESHKVWYCFGKTRIMKTWKNIFEHLNSMGYSVNNNNNKKDPFSENLFFSSLKSYQKKNHYAFPTTPISFNSRGVTRIRIRFSKIVRSHQR